MCVSAVPALSAQHRTSSLSQVTKPEEASCILDPVVEHDLLVRNASFSALIYTCRVKGGTVRCVDNECAGMNVCDEVGRPVREVLDFPVPSDIRIGSFGTLKDVLVAVFDVVELVEDQVWCRRWSAWSIRLLIGSCW